MYHFAQAFWKRFRGRTFSALPIVGVFSMHSFTGASSSALLTVRFSAAFTRASSELSFDGALTLHGFAMSAVFHRNLFGAFFRTFFFRCAHSTGLLLCFYKKKIFGALHALSPVLFPALSRRGIIGELFSRSVYGGVVAGSFYLQHFAWHAPSAL